MKKVVEEFYEARDWDQFHNLKDLAVGIPTRVNELLDIFRFQLEEQMRGLISDQTIHSHIQRGLADTLFSLLRLAQTNDTDLYDMLTDKVSKNGQWCIIENSKGRNIKIHGQRSGDTLVYSPFL